MLRNVCKPIKAEELNLIKTLYLKGIVTLLKTDICGPLKYVQTYSTVLAKSEEIFQKMDMRNVPIPSWGPDRVRNGQEWRNWRYHLQSIRKQDTWTTRNHNLRRWSRKALKIDMRQVPRGNFLAPRTPGHVKHGQIW